MMKYLTKCLAMGLVLSCGTPQNHRSSTADSTTVSAETSEEMALFKGAAAPGLCQDLARIRPTTDNDDVFYSCSIALSPCKPSPFVSCSAVAVYESASGTTPSHAKYQLATKVCANKNYWPQLPNSFSAFKPQCAAYAY